MERMSEKKSQPTRSLNIADAMITMPMFVLNKFMSIRMRAITGSAEMESAVPRKSAKR